MIRNSLKIGSWTFLSRISGMIRDIALATFMGADSLTDSFFLAFTLPNFFRRFFAEGAFNAAFVPQFTAIRLQVSSDAARQYVQNILSGLMGVLILLVLFVEFLTPRVISLLAPGFQATPERFLLTVQLARLMFPYILLVALANIFAGILNSLNRFSAAAATPLLLNLCMIGALCFLVPFFPTPGHALAMGVLFAGFLHFVSLRLCSNRLFPVSITWPSYTPAVRQFLKHFGAASLGASVMHFAILLNTIFGSWLVAGSISYLYYADRLVQFPLALIGLALSTALLPELSKAVHTDNQPRIKSLQGQALFISLFLVLPAACGLLYLAQPIIQLLFQHGAFDSHDTLLTTRTLQAYTLALPAYVLSKLANSCFFSYQDTRTPALLSLAFLITHFCFILLLAPLWGSPGIALSFGISSWVNTGLLGFFLWKRKLWTFPSGFLRILLKISVGCLSMLVFLNMSEPYIARPHNLFQEICHLLLHVGGGSIVFIACSWILGLRPHVLKSF